MNENFLQLLILSLLTIELNIIPIPVMTILTVNINVRNTNFF